MKKGFSYIFPHLKQVILISAFMLAAISVNAAFQVAAFAASLPIDPDIYAGSIPAPAIEQTGQEIIKELVLSALGYVKAIISVIGILYITIIGYKLVVLGDNEEEVTKARTGLIYAIIAFALISMSQDIGRVFDMEKGTILGSPQEIIKRVALFDKQVEIVITFIKYTIGAFATLMVIRSAIKLITAGGNEEETTKHKKGILYSAGGLILIYVGDIFVNKVFYKVNKNIYTGMTGVQPTVDPEAGVNELVGITNFVLSFVGPIAVLMLIIASVMYATAGGEEERMEQAKRLLTAVAIGIILIYSSFVLVSTILAGKLENVGAIIQ